MGIHGLTSFLNRTYLDDILEDIKLSNCLLLVDGYSLLHKFYQSLNSLQSAHGGNYDTFACKLNELFEMFIKCEITCIFLFDGGRDKSDKKFQTSLNRAKDRINEACYLNTLDNSKDANNNKKMKLTKIDLVDLVSTGNYRIFNNFLPVLAYKIFFDMLKKHDIIHYQSNFEADYELACLANEMQCPLLSCDSDFFIYDLNYGYISIEYFEMTPLSLDDTIDDKTSFYMPARIYHINKFLEFYNQKLNKISRNLTLRKELLPIFAIILGNDYVDNKIFKSLLNSFDSTNNNLKFKGLKRNVVKSKETCYNKILEWLAKFENVDECINSMFNFVKKESHQQIRSHIDDSIREYMCLKSSFTSFYKMLVQKRLSNDGNDDISMLLTHKQDERHLMRTFNGIEINDSKFLKSFLHCELTRVLLDILTHRQIIFRCQIEIAEWPSTFLSSIDIRKFLYSLLLSKYEFVQGEPTIVIKEYLRYQNEMKIYEVPLDTNVASYSLNDLNFLLDKLFKLKSNVTKRLIDVKMSLSLKYFLAALYFWLNSSKTNENGFVDREFEAIKNRNSVKAFVVSLIKSSVIDPCYLKIKSSPSTSQQVINESSSILNYEPSSNCSLIDEFLAFEQDDNFMNSLREHILSKESNYDYIKDVYYKFYSFSSSSFVTNQLINKSSSSKANKLLNLRTVHCLCEFQSIYLSLNYAKEVIDLSNLNDNIFNILDLKYFFNGTFLHNFMDELSRRSNPDLYIEETFGRKSLFKHLYIELINIFDNIFAQ